MECLVVGNNHCQFQDLTDLGGSRWESKSAHFVSPAPSSVNIINEVIAFGDDDTEEALILSCHSATTVTACFLIELPQNQPKSSFTVIYGM